MSVTVSISKFPSSEVSLALRPLPAIRDAVRKFAVTPLKKDTARADIKMLRSAGGAHSRRQTKAKYLLEFEEIRKLWKQIASGCLSGLTIIEVTQEIIKRSALA